MGWLLFPLRLPMLLVWGMGGLITVLAIFPCLNLNARRWLIRHWSRVLMVICGVAIRLHGRPKREGPVLWVANHVSWVDIFVLNSVRAVSFIAKSDIRHWPLLGWLVAGAGTLFIERGKRHAVRAVGHQMSEQFQRGSAVGLFPEGTTSEGLSVLPFHSSLFEPALRAGVDIQPVALRFFHHGRRTQRYAFVGEQTLAHNIWNLLTSTGTVISIDFWPVTPAAVAAELGRAAMAAKAESQIRVCVENELAGPEDSALRGTA